jgi:hypothetical protein
VVERGELTVRDRRFGSALESRFATDAADRRRSGTGRVGGLTFDRGVERAVLPDETLTPAYADALLEQIADVCEPAFEPV